MADTLALVVGQDETHQQFEEEAKELLNGEPVIEIVINNSAVVTEDHEIRTNHTNHANHANPSNLSNPSNSSNPSNPVNSAILITENDGLSVIVSDQIEAPELAHEDTKQTHEPLKEEPRGITICLGTWNVNGKKPSESLEPWLCDPTLQHDVYAVGFQEVFLPAESIFLADTNRVALWEQQIMNTLSLQGEYVKIITKQLVGMLMCVYVKKEHQPYVKNVHSGVAAVGMMGMMGNKGGVAIRFNLYDSSICIVNAHLSAHSENVTRRNQDMKEIARRITFYKADGSTSSIYDHDMLFWIGDLNYRIQLSDIEVQENIHKGEWATLFHADQLYRQMKLGATFEGFQESPIQFAPTYKYDIGTTSYDSSEKKRTPAWCDRVLWRNGKDADNIFQVTYKRHELLSSDHRPVSASFQLNILPEKRSELDQELANQFEKDESEFEKEIVKSNRKDIPLEETLSSRDVVFNAPLLKDQKAPENEKQRVSIHIALFWDIFRACTCSASRKQRHYSTL